MRSALTLAVLTFGAGYRVLPTRKRTVANVARMAQVGRSVTLLMVAPIFFTQVRPVSDLKQRLVLPQRIRA
jgi:hypothetical protein